MMIIIYITDLFDFCFEILLIFLFIIILNIKVINKYYKLIYKFNLLFL
jgi:hypothetical protein